MLTDIGPLQIEEKYVGRNIIGTEVKTEIPAESNGFSILMIMIGVGFTILSATVFDGPNSLKNGGWTLGSICYPLFFILLGITMMAASSRQVEVNKYGNRKENRIKYYFTDGKYNRWDFDKEYDNEYQSFIRNQQENPILIGDRDDSKIRYWLYKDKIWKENEEYYANELQMLADEKLEKKKLRLERAERAKERRENPNVQDDDERSRRISDDVKDRVWNRDGGKCVKCGSNEDLEFDHIIPFSKGGANTYRNLQLLCEHCNRSKSAKIG